MKKFMALICALLIVCSLAACSNNQTDNSTTPSDSTSDVTPEIRDPQKENAIPTEDLTKYAEATGKLSNYRLAYGYTSTSENIVTIVLHDGKDQQQRRVFYNDVNPDGTATLRSQTDFRYVWSENAKYTVKTDGEEKTEHTFTLSAEETTFAKMVDSLVCDGFYAAISESVPNATYDIIADHYDLSRIELTNGSETFIFDDVFITIDAQKLKTINCTNGTQTIVIELTGANDVTF